MQRTAIITGSSSGIGLASATEFLRKGFRVFGVDMFPTFPAPAPKGLEFIQADIASPDDVQRVLQHLEAQTDMVDVLVNNAGVCPHSRSETEFLALWNRVLSVNLTGPFLLTQGTLPLLKRAPSGSVVNVASVHALVTTKGMAAYAASKGGLVSLTRALALELAEYGIRVNCVLPGAVDTPMILESLRQRDLDGGTAEERLQCLASRTPLQKIGSPEEIAKAICFLGSAEEASFITGQTLVVDGGALARLSTE
ncbi:MAG: SDR family oxidoreductase [Desulfomonile tiedjei]|nr:SDR family oxidoreductase [Desulfomonile tiedjei]